MSTTHRNKIYETSLRRPEAVRVKNWLEIGPGPFGVLTKMVLKRDKESKVVSIETVKESAEGLIKRLGDYIKAKRLVVSPSPSSFFSWYAFLWSDRLPYIFLLTRLFTALRETYSCPSLTPMQSSEGLYQSF